MTQDARVFNVTRKFQIGCIADVQGNIYPTSILPSPTFSPLKSHRDLFQESFNTPITLFLGAYAAAEEEQSGVW